MTEFGDLITGSEVALPFMVNKEGISVFTDTAYKGTVIYIHPMRRFFTAEFEIRGNKLRESYDEWEYIKLSRDKRYDISR